LADPGGICVSKTAFDQIETKLPLGYEYLGEQEVKNIPKPVGAYRVLMEPRVTVAEEIEKVKAVPVWQRKSILAGGVVFVLVVIAALIWNFYLRPPPMEVASVEKMAFPLPDEPSIAVLPFTNMSGDPQQEYFSDGLTEEIITALSKVRRLFVVARNSTFVYKRKPIKVKQVSEDLGVRYVLEGSVRKSGEQIRITAQLVDAIKGSHLWAERYNLEMKDVFILQDKITKKIITELQVTLTEGEQARLWEKGTNNIDAFLKFLQGLNQGDKRSVEGNIRAIQLFKQAIALDPQYAVAYAWLGNSHFWSIRFGRGVSRKETVKKAFKLAKKAVSMDESNADCHYVLARAYRYQKNHEKALAHIDRALALNPNHVHANFLKGAELKTLGRYEEAISHFKRAYRLNPFYKPAFGLLGSTYVDMGKFEEAIHHFEKLNLQEASHVNPLIFLTQAYMGAGREDTARETVKKILLINPDMTVDRFKKMNAHVYQDAAILEFHAELLRKAGLPEKPPLPFPDKPSIAVLPFTNLSDDPKQEYFADGMTGDLITDLSKISGLFVIARNSVFRYKGKLVDVKKVKRELGVRYVLEGSVRKAGGQVRINALLIDATTEGHLWAERYDGKLDDVFALQDKITQKIVTELAVRLTSDEKKEVTKKETENIAAYDAFLKGWGHYLRQTPEDFAEAVSYFEKATELDPNYGRAYASMALIYSRVSELGRTWLEPLYLRDAWLADRQAKKYLKLAMRNPTSTAYRVASFINIHDRRYDEAIANAERALSLEPNDTGSNENMAFVLIMAGEPHEAFDFARKAMRCDPHNLANPLYYIGLAHFCLKEFEEAVNYLERALTYSPRHTVYLRTLAAAYGLLGREKEARAALERSPAEGRSFIFDAKGWILEENYPPLKKLEMRDLFEEGWLKAGLGEN
jgi:TolB-like protein/Flp pilus assembly protein TadD